MKDPKTIVTTAAGLVLVGVATWLISTTQEATVNDASFEYEIEKLQMQIDNLTQDIQSNRRHINALEKHEHDKKGTIILP
jgi:peptidoglycan hydrolase CwlO-like protein